MATKNTIILAAGKGTRMKSKLYKVLHRLCGKTMVDHVLTAVEGAHMDNIVTVVGFGADAVRDNLGDRTQYVVQEKQLGTGHAVLQAEQLLGHLDGMTMVVSGDTPLFTTKTFEDLFTYHQNKKAKVTILTSKAPNPTGYGRIVRNDLGIVEKKLLNKRMPLKKSRRLMKLTPVSTCLTTGPCSKHSTRLTITMRKASTI